MVEFMGSTDSMMNCITSKTVPLFYDETEKFNTARKKNLNFYARGIDLGTMTKLKLKYTKPMLLYIF